MNLPPFVPSSMVQAIARAIAAERAACALLADDLCAPNVAKMIRARGNVCRRSNYDAEEDVTRFHHWHDVAKFIMAYRGQHGGEYPEQIRVDFSEWTDIKASADPEMIFRDKGARRRFEIMGVPIIIKPP